MRAMWQTAIVGWIILAATGCTPTVGRDFKTPDLNGLVLGQTTANDTTATYGEPYEKAEVASTATPVLLFQNLASPFAPFPKAGDRETVRYFYKKGTEYKSFAMLFFNGKLVDYSFASNFSGHATDFDETRIQLLTKAKTTKSEMTALFGGPTGMSIYPQMRDVGSVKIKYYYETPTLNMKSVKLLEGVFDKNDVLVDYQYASKSVPVVLPVINTPSAIYIPPVTKKGK